MTATISRNGDLIHRAYLRVQLPDVSVPSGTTFRWLNWVGHILIKSVELEIGGQRIDKHYGDQLIQGLEKHPAPMVLCAA